MPFVGPIVSDKRVKFRDPRLIRSGGIQPKAFGCGIFGRFSNCDNWRPEVAGDGIASAPLCRDGSLWKCCDSGLNSGRVIRPCPAEPGLRTFV